jgi:ATPases involved in chromosome partitioning
MTKIIAVANQKGGVGKTTSVLNIGTGLVAENKKVLLIDTDPQGNLTMGLGFDPDDIPLTLTGIMTEMAARRTTPDNLEEYILKNDEGVDLIPSDMNLEEVQTQMQSMVGGKGNFLLKEILNQIQAKYDYILIDCPPSIGALTYNAMIAADAAIIPTQAQAFSAKGSIQLYQHIQYVQSELNPSLHIMGILITMLTARSKSERHMIQKLREVYNEHIPIFEHIIPRSVRAGESNDEGVSIHIYDPDGKIAAAYRGCVKEVIHGTL